jgi:hypothetical protein
MGLDPQTARLEPDAAAAPPPVRWYHKLAALVYIVFCFEVGVFLVLFPWIEPWHNNFFSELGGRWHLIWNSPFLRGAVSGLGLIDIGISLSELLRLRRFVRASGRVE